ncbi:ABC transporter ATP-binding protein [Clostridium aestuarii]|uniref:ABC transporter ATP-binding protein n=1 Tax=Clostridium aestuarii TaxID=338193 RepID=A0ABT4D0Y1_9CLOT|nr:ABC transporter ATP-binding protein [Clostridium aestuarii]MCY6484901.1 ABC transporter ATP-binding protein [Clostridium aestuarii]
MIEINGACKNLGDKHVLKDINLKVNKGSIFGIIGENGAGKTTLIKCLTGIFKVDEGEIKMDGQEVFENPAVKEKIGYVADQNQYFPYFKIKELIEFYKMTYPSFSTERFKELNKIFDIPEEKRIKELSKGMKMRAALMLNLSIHPKVLILDEPTSGLDPIIKKKVMSILMEEVAERKTTIFISSHHLNDLERICDSIAIISDGEIKYVNNIENMKENIKKLQVVFKEGISADIGSWKEIMTVEKIGRVYYIITKDYSKDLKQKLYNHGVMFAEEINLSLEDMFIYSMEGRKDNEKILA